MISVIRNKFGPYIVGAIIAFIAFVFIFYGIFPGSKMANQGGTMAGEVNGEPITLGEFNREYNRRVEFFKGIMGGEMKEEQIKAFGIREGVFRELANRKLMVQEAERLGKLPSDEEIRDEIIKIEAFKKDGVFDKVRYRQMLEANGYTLGSFEKMVRDDLIDRHWKEQINGFAQVSDLEIKQDYLENGTKRAVKYVLLTPESAQKSIDVPQTEITAFLADPGKANLAQSRFNAKAGLEYKGKTFEQVKNEIAHGLIASEKSDVVKKTNQGLAEKVLAMMERREPDAKINEAFKSLGIKVQTTESMPKKNFYVAGFSQSPELIGDVYAKPPSTKPKKYEGAAGILVAQVTQVDEPDLSKWTGTDQAQIRKQLLSRKQSEIFSEWMQKLSKKAKIEMNGKVVNGASAESDG